MLAEGVLTIKEYDRSQWYHLANENPEGVAKRLAQLQPLWTQFTDGATVGRTGQSLEIAVFRAMREAGIDVYGGFGDLTAHDDDKLYSKTELQQFNGATLGKHALDFIVRVGTHHCGIEVKNTRPWFYAHDAMLRDLIRKALTFKVLPVLVARRIHYVTFRVLGTCGLIMHETYNQRMAMADHLLADQVKQKDLLGYHDIRTGNSPDGRLQKFFRDNLPKVVAEAADRINKYEDLLWAFADRSMEYAEFAARVRRRELGQKEDNDWPEEEEQNCP